MASLRNYDSDSDWDSDFSARSSSSWDSDSSIVENGVVYQPLRFGGHKSQKVMHHGNIIPPRPMQFSDSDSSRSPSPVRRMPSAVPVRRELSPSRAQSASRWSGDRDVLGRRHSLRSMMDSSSDSESSRSPSPVRRMPSVVSSRLSRNRVSPVGRRSIRSVMDLSSDSDSSRSPSPIRRIPVHRSHSSLQDLMMHSGRRKSEEQLAIKKAKKKVKKMVSEKVKKMLSKKDDRLSEQIPLQERTVSDAIKALSRPVNVSIHKEVLSKLEEMAKANNMKGIQDMIAEIKKNPSAAKHVKDYPSQYQKALGEHYDNFSKMFQSA